MSSLARLIRLLVLATCILLPATAAADDDDGVFAGAAYVTEIRETSAKVIGYVGTDKTTYWWVEYGLTAAYGSRTAVMTAGASGYKSVTLTGLAPGTAHHVRLVVANGSQRSTGPGRAFTTTAAGAVPAADEVAPPAVEEPPAADQPSGPGVTDLPPVNGTPAGNGTPIEQPQLGKRVVAGVEAGEIRIRVPGTSTFQVLGADASIPVGSVVDARAGTIALTSARAGGATQTGEFRGSLFKVRQATAGKGYVDLHLRGGLADCGRATRSLASAAARKPRKARKLWGTDDGGRFRTHGRDSVATVRGTQWSMTDRCDGTLTEVREGAVDVKVLRTGRVVRVRAGQRHFARHTR